MEIYLQKMTLMFLAIRIQLLSIFRARHGLPWSHGLKAFCPKNLPSCDQRIVGMLTMRLQVKLITDADVLLKNMLKFKQFD